MKELIIHLGPLTDPNSGRPAVLRGYAAVFGAPSALTFERDLPEVLAPEAFDRILAEGRTPNVVLNHMGANGFLAAADAVRVWKDSIGLAFEAINLRHTDLTRSVVRLIAEGTITTCSWQTVGFPKGGRNIEKVDDGREMHVIRDAGNVFEIGPCRYAVFQETGIWLSSMEKALPAPRLYRLARSWKQSAPAGVQA